MAEKNSQSIGLVALFIVVAALSRFLPHPPNFTAVGAMGLFGVAYLNKKWLAFLIPLIVLYISNLILDNVVYAAYYESFQWLNYETVYLAFIVMMAIGALILRKVKISNVLAASVAVSLVFFLITNAQSWMVDPIYTKDISGLVTAYTAGLPFFWNTLAGNLFYSLLMFGAYEVVTSGTTSSYFSIR